MFEPTGSNPKLCEDCFRGAVHGPKKEPIRIPRNQEINLAIDKLIFNYIYSIKGISDRLYEKIAKEWSRIKNEEKQSGKINKKVDRLIFDYIYSLKEVPDKIYIRIVKKWDKMKAKQKQKEKQNKKQNKNDNKKNRPKI